MSIYLKPPKMNKEDFLATYGIMVDFLTFSSFRDFNKGVFLPVCWILTKSLSVATICCSEQDLNHFDTIDKEHQFWFFVLKTYLYNQELSGVSYKDIQDRINQFSKIPS